MPATLEREEVAREIFLLTDRDFHTVAALVEELLDDEPPFSDSESGGIIHEVRVEGDKDRVEIAKSLFGILPMTMTFEEAREEKILEL